MRVADHPVIALEKRRARARLYQTTHHRSTGLGGRAGKKLTDAAFYAPRAARPCPPPNVCAGIDPEDLKAGRARPARRSPKGD